ncbi:MAG: Alanine--tRNA ligase [Candidatus Anoxychlamydiales bacterium]|nr:Alanine--tRNA ligase [Candidatus Anoxychlamydiales bacterium]
MISKDIRRGFLNYFKTQSHTVVPSSSLLPQDDPTLLFTNAGMNQFKDVFLGKSKRSYKRATTTQKCIRAGGKHNDLENVGFTSRHLTFFEMLGNFSFGDYFKKEAIGFAYDVSVNVFGLDPDKIWATVYTDDDEAFELWQKHLPISRIVRFGEEENFWAMGDIGPCGPCSELLYDRGEKYSDAKSPIYDTTGERFLEYWNLVFMQFNRDETKKMSPLPNKSIDTGAGLERIVGLKMKVESVFEIDIFQELIHEIEKISKIKYDKENKDLSPAFHVISDHIRCLAFAIADGIIPSNIERGYVLRKILRRAARYGKLLKLNEPFLAKILPTLSSIMGDDFEELKASERRTAEILTLEEELFIKTLNRGGSLMQDTVSRAKKEKRQILGEEAFKLKDTYGFPIEEILLLAKDEHLKVDLKTFNDLENEAKDRSKKAQEKHLQTFDKNFFEDFTKTHSESIFAGHKSFETESTILAIIDKNEFTDELSLDECGIIILDQTPFYAEMGGQVGDRGEIFIGENLFKVEDTQTPYPGVIIHIGKVTNGKFTKGKKVKAKIDIERRKKIEANHSATHLLHWALAKVLGEHIKQAGSVVDEKRLRFDFDHHKALSLKEIREVERVINEKIRENIKVTDYEISFEEAQKDNSIKQIFGEKYSDVVRVIDMGFAKELCGGAHTAYTGNVGYFRIFKESSIAQGVRRIEATTSAAAEDFVYDTEDVMKNLAINLKVPENRLEEKILSLIAENKNLYLELKQEKQKELKNLISNLVKNVEKINSVNLITEKISIDPKDLKSFSETILQNVKSAVIALACKVENRYQFFIKISPDLIDKNIFANDLINEISPIINGKGGGRKDTAQAGSTDFEKIEDAFNKIKKILQEKH